MLQKAYIHMGDYKAALQLQNQLDTIIGYNAMSAMQRYRLNAMMKNNKQAIYEVERYLEEDPDNMQFQVFRAQLYEETQQPPAKMAVAYEAFKVACGWQTEAGDVATGATKQEGGNNE